jgi:hypothetical protein
VIGYRERPEEKMKIRTTLHLDASVIDSIAGAALAAGLDRNRVVSSLMRHCAAEAKKRPSIWRRVRYQGRNEGGNWRRMHVALNPDGYEYSIDMRKMMKMSVSFIVAYAVEHYLDEVLEILQKVGDNYCYRNYAMMQVSINEVICWVLCWGIPRKTISIPL